MGNICRLTMDNAKIISVLERIGLTPNEIKIYLVLNSSGAAKAGKIAKLAHIDRSSCYNSLKSLIDKGLISYSMIGNVKWFQTASPKRLIEYLEEQEGDVRSILPILEEQRSSKTFEGQVRLFKGIKGLKNIYMDIIRTGEDNFVFGSEGQFVELMPEFALLHNKLKKQKGIKTKVIIRDGRNEPFMTQGTYRYMKNVKESSAITDIYGDKIAIFIYTDEPEAIVIENKAAALAYRSYFEVLWNIAGKSQTKNK